MPFRKLTFEASPGGEIVFPEGTFEGTRAITTQGYNESNSKLGKQFFFSVSKAGVAYIYFATSAKPVTIRKRIFDYIAEEVTIQILSGVTYSSISNNVYIQNLNKDTSETTTVSVGTPNGLGFSGSISYIPDEVFFGSSVQPRQTVASISDETVRIIPPFTEVVIRIAYTGSTGFSGFRINYYLEWSEGEEDLPV